MTTTWIIFDNGEDYGDEDDDDMDEGPVYWGCHFADLTNNLWV